MTFDVRPIAEDEFDTWERTFSFVFGFDPKPDDSIWREVTEFDRTIGVFDGGDMVGTGGAFTMQMTVPGGASVGAGGLTAISVSPTHRRRGILTSMIQNHFEDVAARSEPVSILWASESVIYGRYGYGAAIQGADLTIARDHGALRADVTEPLGSMRVTTDTGSVRPLVEKVYEKAVIDAGIPGSLARNEGFWNMYFHDPEHWRDGATSLRVAVYERDGEPQGYAKFRQKELWEEGHPNNTTTVIDLQGADGEAYAAMWRFMLGMDLVATTKIRNRRSHDPVLDLLADPRRVKHTRYETIWVRILDVPAALEARRYDRAGSVVIEVTDDFGPWAGGTYRLDGGPEGAACVPTDDRADVKLGIADLSSAYLGDSRLSTLGWLGRVDGDAEAIATLDAMFGWHLQPWCTVGF